MFEFFSRFIPGLHRESDVLVAIRHGTRRYKLLTIVIIIKMKEKSEMRFCKLVNTQIHKQINKYYMAHYMHAMSNFKRH